jgi:hypothetical protein
LNAAAGGPVSRRVIGAFAILIAAQAAHSIEEVVTGLYAVMPPAAFVSSLFAPNPRTGFAIGNALLVGLGVACWLFAFRHGGRRGRMLAWGWAILEAANGIGHITLAIGAGGYFPGVATAPLLLLASGWLIVNLRR